METAAKGGKGFALKMHQELVSDGKNLFFSPYSISSAMSMLLLGCSGESKKELMTLLEGDESIHDENSTVEESLAKVIEEMELTSANRLFVEKSYNLLEKFVSDCVEKYKSEACSLDFKGDADGSRKLINDWVSKQTKDKIKDLIGQGAIDSLTRVILVNAIYFKGKWESEFQKQNTHKREFHVSPSNSSFVEMMLLNKKFHFSKVDGLGAKLLELDYKGGAVSMVIVLPMKMFDLPAVEKKFTLQHLEELRYKTDVKLVLPKFKLEYGCDLVKTFSKLNVSGIFKGGKDLAGISGADDLYVSGIVHKAFVEVNEEGTVAAAATAVILKRCRAGPPRQVEEFICDHPFMFLIRHKHTNTILFMGRYSSPSK